MNAEQVAEWVWFGRGPGPAAARAALAPAELLFRAVAGARGALYDARVARAHALGLPALSVGNLTVGGTGKTPVAAWACAELARRGARPALLTRGVGGDEARVHALLNPGVPVVADPNRVRGARRAAAAGATALVLDDAFQHRRARRDVDLVLVSAERHDGRARRLPAGPYREGFSALRRASAVVVTRKAASAERAGAVLAAVLRAGTTAVAGAVVHLAPEALRRWGTEEEEPLAALRDRGVLTVAGVGDPHAFVAQLEGVGARVTLARFPDHHAYDAADTAALAERARRVGTAVTTLKDAVKLGPLWPDTGPALWYVTQRVTVERGEDALAARLDAVAAAARDARAPDAPAP